ncbi:MAG: HRDC domain-containing protein, partial [Myxococcota bacterium]|nr:HRDC domain-containing protein [Myxococcota bacterium]
ARKALAQRDDVPLYSVATNRSLRDMAHKRPQTPQGLQRIHGMGPMRIRKYGRRFIEVINGFKFE